MNYQRKAVFLPCFYGLVPIDLNAEVEILLMDKRRGSFIGYWVVLMSFVACQYDSPISISREKKVSEAAVEEMEVVEEVSEKVNYDEVKDGLFDDFIYRFMQDSLFQKARIQFPLISRKDGDVSQIEASAWSYDSIYSEADEYSSVYDGRDTLQHVCDEKVKKATVEIVDLKGKRVKLYHFFREQDQWILKEIDEHYFSHDNNHGFFAFYCKFSNDESYQLKHIHDPFYFKTYDADNFQEIEGWVAAESWPDYRTYLPNEKLFNTIYDDKRPSTAYRRLSIGSPSSGMSCSLLFRCLNGSWKLVSMEN